MRPFHDVVKDVSSDTAEIGQLLRGLPIRGVGKFFAVDTHQTSPENNCAVMKSTIAPKIDAGSSDAPRVTAWRIVSMGDAMLEREAEQHGGVARDRLDVVPGLAAVNEDFARRAVGIETDGDREQLVPEPQAEGLCGPALGRTRRITRSLPHRCRETSG